MITEEQINNAKLELGLKNPDYGDDDCIRIAYEWLDAQKKTKHPRHVEHDIKHLVENWADTYISRFAVALAAYLHPKIKGFYPFYNISSRLTEPSITRLQRIGIKYKSLGQRSSHKESNYYFHE